MSKKFSQLNTPEEIALYLSRVWKRKYPKGASLYHYSLIQNIANIIKGKCILLGSISSMNDWLEEDFIRSNSSKQMSFSCFSRAEENLAMYKMYAGGSNSTGAILNIPFDAAEELVNGVNSLTVYELQDKDFVATLNTVDVDLYWTAVGYKEIHKDVIHSGTVTNSHIKDPMKQKALVGCLKFDGWEYEKEVRLVATYDKKLEDNQRLGVQIPDDVIPRLSVIKSPCFSANDESREAVREIRRVGVTEIHDSFYEDYVKL